MEKVYCKDCQHLRNSGGALSGRRECVGIMENTYYQRKNGDPSKLNANNDCKFFKLKKKFSFWKCFDDYPWWPLF